MIVHLDVHAEPGQLDIRTPADARKLGLESLRKTLRQDGGVPLPSELENFIADRNAAVTLGKALFWDMQVGSDGVQACASCHFHAGADDRAVNAINPTMRAIVDNWGDPVTGYFFADFVDPSNFEFDYIKPNRSLKPEDFPFVKEIGKYDRTADGVIIPVSPNSNDIAGSMGVFATQYGGIQPGAPVDNGTPLLDRVFNVDGKFSVRGVEPRNTPTVINAVFNFNNFWDGRASNIFNGKGAFGNQDRNVTILINDPSKGLSKERIALDNASLASQAMQPPSSPVEMSFNLSTEGLLRSMPDIGQKLLRASPSTGAPVTPLGRQRVSRYDSTLGSLSRSPAPGLNLSYAELVRKAFKEQYWNSNEEVELLSVPSPRKFSQMEANFGLFFGLSVLMYESTLVSDQTPFDRWMETGRFRKGFAKDELVGLNLFVKEGKCLTCHVGPELTSASVREIQGGKKAIRAMAMGQGYALYDNGFYNTSVTPTTDDAGRGDLDINDQPLSFARRALFDRLGIDQPVPPLVGNDFIPAQDESHSVAVCDDSDGSGYCESTETIHPEFQRVAADGAFKTPGLRNVELTGPYFHNGGMATLRQVVQFYNRGGNFCNFNQRDMDVAITPLGLSQEQEERLVDFLVALTDTRVKFQRAPFDHPELRIPRNGLDPFGMRTLPAVGAWGSNDELRPFLDLEPQDAIFTPEGTCQMDAP